MKLLGAVLIILSGLCLGLRKAGELQRRETALLDLKRTLQHFHAGVSFSARPLAELITENRDSLFCCLAAEDERCPWDPGAALERAGETLLQKDEDISLYRNFVRELGNSDSKSQLKHLELCSALLENNLAEARSARMEKTRLYVCLGIFGGITLCLVLL